MNDDRSSEPDVESADGIPGRSPDPDPLSTDQLHRLLANSRRRLLLSYLQSHTDESVSFEDLVAAIARGERPDPGPATHWQRVETDLHHVHLPKLADAGVLEYDPVTRTVEYEPSDELEAALSHCLEIEQALE